MTSSDLTSVKELLLFFWPVLPKHEERSVRYEHMGALIADASLQAAVNYEQIVRPRVEAILERYPEHTRTRDLRAFRYRSEVRAFLQWKGEEKVNRFTALVGALTENKIESIDELAEWLQEPEARESLLSIRGIGEKTFDYLGLLCGASTFPLDRHFIRFLRLAGIDVAEYGYQRAQELLTQSCSDLGLDPYRIERGLWTLLRACV